MLSKFRNLICYCTPKCHLNCVTSSEDQRSIKYCNEYINKILSLTFASSTTYLSEDIKSKLYLVMIFGKWPTWRTILSMYLFLFLHLYTFRAHRAHHQERKIVSIQPLVTVTLCCWPCRVQVGSEITYFLNTFAASYLNTQGLNNSCLKSRQRRP